MPTHTPNHHPRTAGTQRRKRLLAKPDGMPSETGGTVLTGDRLALLRLPVGDLESVCPSKFGPLPVGDPDTRRTIRFMSALAPSTVPDDDLDSVIADVVGNPGLDPERVREILSGQTDLQPDASTLREAGRMLREGLPRQEVATGLGIDPGVVTELAGFLGVVEARLKFLRDQVVDAR